VIGKITESMFVGISEGDQFVIVSQKEFVAPVQVLVSVRGLALQRATKVTAQNALARREETLMELLVMTRRASNRS
jgi:hypothetical protein